MPAKVLEAIFTLLVSHDTPRKGHIGWIRVSHVCSKWRAAAIGSARLWCNIPVDVLDNRWVSIFVQRSGNEPITWEMPKIWTSPYFAPPPRSPLSPHVQTLIQENLDHIAKLRLYLPASTPENKKWIRTLGAKASLLTSLDLDCLFSPPVSLASSMAPFAAPLLSELVLKGISPDLAGVSWSNLLTLNICNAQLDFHPLLAVLSSAPKLKELTLRDIYLSSTTSTGAHNRVFLSKIQKLDLRSDPRTCVIICKALSIPPIPSYRVDFAGPQISFQSGVDPIIDVISVIRERVRDAYCSERPLYQLEISQQSQTEELWGDVTIECGDERCDEEAELEGDGIMNFFKLSLSRGRISDENTLSLLKSLSLGTCVKMHASGYLLSDGDVWMDILPDLSRVDKLEVCLRAGQPFIEAAFELFDDTTSILPRLTWFTLNMVNLRAPYDDDPPIPIQLYTWIVDRQTRAGVKALHQLEVICCPGLTAKQKDLFYKLEGMGLLMDE
ncbi:hypothetical protein PENSPDRAFT_246119 [Peniophora sp. CONT]|nr:hypothetical protein PENSPDRAFT_246119 [Peniophora sp. CONT]